MRLLVLLGTRPEAIKMAPVILELKKLPHFDVQVVSTGQHSEMLKPILKFFEIEPDIDLQLMRPGQTLVEITTQVMTGLNTHYPEDNIAGILVQGDTASCMAGSVWAFLRKIPVFHVEAGLRTGDLQAPWPEEFNRRVTSIATSLHFAPTPMAAENIIKEGVARHDVYMVGNTVVDALLSVSEKMDQKPLLQQQMRVQFPFLDSDKKLVLATVHRRENFGGGLQNIFNALKQLADRANTQVVIPLHLNPNVQEAAKVLRGSNVHIIKPQSYIPFVYLMKRADLILTDSGGIQEEAPYLNKPVLVLRESTERPESIAEGVCQLVGTNVDVILKESNRLLDSTQARTVNSSKPYGDGDSAQKIVRIINEYLQQRYGLKAIS